MALNVLVVDDSAVMRTMIIRMLKLCRVPTAGVYQAGNGAEALELLDRTWIDLALVDINMPVMDGEQLICCMRARPAMADLPILVVSTEGSATRIERIRSMGARFVHKPFPPETLRDEIVALTGVSIDDTLHGVAGSGDLDF